MKAHINRIISLLLVAVLTVPICTNTLQTAERFEVVQTLKAQGNYYPDDFTEQRFTARSAEVEKLIGDAGMAADANFTQKVTSLFTQLYRLMADLLTGRLSLSDAEVTRRAEEIFSGLFELDRQVQAKKARPDETAKDGFVAMAASILWDFMDYYDAKRLEEQEMTEGVRVVRDLPYTENANEYQTLDIYYPPNAEAGAKYPVIVDIHGGGLMYGKKELNRVYASRLAARGYIVVAINYRLCPDVLYSEQVRDVMASYKWVAENSELYGFDTDNAYVVGDSAGGQLAFYTSIVNTSAELRALYNVPDSGLHFNAAGLISGMYDMKSGVNSLLISCMLGYTYYDSPYYPYLQPEEVIDKGTLPPSYIVTSAKDFLRPASLQLDKLLTEKNLPHQLHDWEITFNRSSGHITSVAYPDLEESVTTIDEMLAFFEAYKNEA